MAYQPTTVTVSASGVVHIPAAVQELESVGYNDEVKMTIFTPEREMDSMSFTGFATSNSKLTVPKHLREYLGLSRGTEITAKLKATGKKWPEDFDEPAQSRVYYRKGVGPDPVDNRTNTHAAD